MTAKRFLDTASPGALAVFIPNVDHKTEDAGLADAMATECEAITKAGIILQIDAPADVALSRHTRRGAPGMMRLHILRGNYGSPNTHDFPVSKLSGAFVKLCRRAFQFAGAIRASSSGGCSTA